jgi:thioredoxin 1
MQGEYMSKNTVEVTSTSFNTEVIESDIPVLVDFWASWCGPCNALAPIIESIAEKFKGKIKVAKLNIDENNDTATLYNIRGIPSILLFKNGKVVGTNVGLITESQLSAFIESNIQ